MATKKSQRIFIWVIAVVMTVGTLAGFIAMILAPQNQKVDQDRITQLTAEYQAEMTAYQEKDDIRTKELSDKYYGSFKAYGSRPAAFTASEVKKLVTKDLKVGDGKELKEGDTEYLAYYIGWNPKGKIFDQSIDGSSLKKPLDPAEGLIEGMTKGVIGMKVGGVREVTIPSDLAYGEAGSGEDIPANTPLKFIVFVIPKKDMVKQPQPSQELINYYQSGAAQ